MNVDVVIVGAGAAGIGAAKAARSLGLEYLVLEASHRIGGRAYTEAITPDIRFDLGCHWLHTASRNPFTQLLDIYGMHADRRAPRSGFFRDGEWIAETGPAAFEAAAYRSMQHLAEAGRDGAAADVYDREDQWAGMLDYWISLSFSTDPDQVSFRDFTDFRNTGEGEDWPVRQGLGAMLHRYGSDVPVWLNSPVTEIDFSGQGVVIRTNRGDVSADTVIVTVSTGVLNAGDIRFSPRLPDWKQEAVWNLQLGNHNRICLVYDRNVFGDFSDDTATCLDGDGPPMFFEVRPFGLNYAVGSTGGRFADWLERAGQEASIEYALEKLVHMFGADARKNITRTLVTAWRGDDWIRGAYSATAPGAHGARRVLARPVDDRLFFAGEATSSNFMATVHGAFISGVREAQRVAALLKGAIQPVQSAEEMSSWLTSSEQALSVWAG